MRHRPPGRAPARRAGAAALELAVLLPFLCFAFVVAVDFARVFCFALTVTNCARNGALYGSADPAHALDQGGIQAAAQRDAANLDLPQLRVTSTTDSPTSPTSVSVTVSYPFSTITRYPGVPAQLTLSRTVQMEVVPATPNFN
jgi:Flp pilus assembly protein TadG